MEKLMIALLGAAVLILGAAGCGAKYNMASSASEAPVSINEPAQRDELSQEAPSESTPEASTVEEDMPDNDWRFDSPENHNADGAMFDRLHDAVKETDVRAVVTVKDGYIIDEYYKDGYDENSVFRLHSCTKSFTSALVGIAIDEGLLDGVDVKIREFFPLIKASNDAYKQEITIRHLLEHTSGFDWPEWGTGTIFREFTRNDNWVEFVLNRPMAAKPGTVFNYTTGGSHLLAAVLQQVTGETAYEFGLEHIFKPMGMGSVKWDADPQGITDGGNGISMTARDAAKFGQLYLEGGKWKGRQIVPEEWVAESAKYQSAGSYGTGEYGYQWWLKTFGENGEYSSYYAMGYAGQYIFIVPELELVTVITGRSQDTYAPQDYFNNYIIAACESGER